MTILIASKPFHYLCSSFRKVRSGAVTWIKTTTLLSAVMAAAVLACFGPVNARAISSSYAEDVGAVVDKVCFSSMEESSVAVDSRKVILLIDRKIDWSGAGSASFWRVVEQVVQNMNDAREGAPGFDLYVAPPSQGLRTTVGRELSTGVLCEHGVTTKCRNRNFWSASGVDSRILAEIVVRETIRDTPLLKACR